MLLIAELAYLKLLWLSLHTLAACSRHTCRAAIARPEFGKWKGGSEPFLLPALLSCTKDKFDAVEDLARSE